MKELSDFLKVEKHWTGWPLDTQSSFIFSFDTLIVFPQRIPDAFSCIFSSLLFDLPRISVWIHWCVSVKIRQRFCLRTLFYRAAHPVGYWKITQLRIKYILTHQNSCTLKYEVPPGSTMYKPYTNVRMKIRYLNLFWILALPSPSQSSSVTSTPPSLPCKTELSSPWGDRGETCWANVYKALWRWMLACTCSSLPCVHLLTFRACSNSRSVAVC